jgi:large subunit ribosomal protein L7/L12
VFGDKMAEKSFNNLVDEIGGMSVIELADFVKALEEKFGVSAAMPMMGAGAAAAAPAAAVAEEKSEYKVTLENSGAEKIKTIKALRAVIPELNLTDAKKMVEEAPQVIKESAPKDLANKIKAELEAAGAKVKLS